MIYLSTGVGQFLAACVPPFLPEGAVRASCPTDRVVATLTGCAYCCPEGSRGTCGPGEKTLSRDAQGCAICCVESEDMARSRCPSPSSVVRDSNGCWNCLCASGPASITCPPGYSPQSVGGRTCCVPPPPPTPPIEPPVVTECPAGAGWRRGTCAAGETVVATDPASGCIRCAPAPGCVPTASIAAGTSPCSVGKKAVVKGAYTCCESAVSPGIAVAGLAVLALFLLRR